MPDFLKRAEARKPDVYGYAFKGMTGEIPLELSWVPKEPPGADGDKGSG